VKKVGPDERAVDVEEAGRHRSVASS
jgi:hypothetical protein